MTSIIQNRYVASRGPGWALLLSLVFAGLLPALVSHRPAADLSSSIPFFDSQEVELVSFVEARRNTASSEPQSVSRFSREEPALFGLGTEPLIGGTVVEKWNRAKAEIAHELNAIEQCLANDDCPADLQKLIALSAEGATRSGRARVGLINRAVDVAIRPVSDEVQWGIADRWSAPIETIRSGRGDCEDYAIVKYLALLEAGISADDVKIVIVRNAFPNEDHAMAAVRVDNQWLILDNRTLTLVRDTDLTRATPEFVLDGGGVRRFLSKDST